MFHAVAQDGFRGVYHRARIGVTRWFNPFYRTGPQLFAPVTWARALWLMVVPIWDSSLVTYSATCSSLKPRSRVSFSFLMSSEARSIGGTVTSVTRYTIQSPPPAPGACAAASFAVR